MLVAAFAFTAGDFLGVAAFLGVGATVFFSVVLFATVAVVLLAGAALGAFGAADVAAGLRTIRVVGFLAACVLALADGAATSAACVSGADAVAS